MEELKPLSFRPNPFEQEYMDKNNLNFSDFVHKSFYNAMRNDWQDKIERIGMRIIIVLLGMGALSFTFLVTNLMAWVILFGCGFFFIIFGMIALGLEVKNGRLYDKSRSIR